MAFLKTAIEALDPSKDKKTELTLALELLAELSAQKVQSFANAIESELRTAGSAENKTVPVSEILARHTEYRAYTSQDVTKIPGEVATAVKGFITGGNDTIVDGVASLVSTALTAILGSGSGQQQEMSSYYIIVQDYAIARYDVRAWSRNIEADGIIKRIETAMAVVAFKSSVDVTKISFNTFLMAYGGQLKAIGLDAGQVKEYLDTAYQVFTDLRRDVPPSLTAHAEPAGVGFLPPGTVVVSAG
jgi:hypothetical protein